MPPTPASSTPPPPSNPCVNCPCVCCAVRMSEQLLTTTNDLLNHLATSAASCCPDNQHSPQHTPKHSPGPSSPHHSPSPSPSPSHSPASDRLVESVQLLAVTCMGGFGPRDACCGLPLLLPPAVLVLSFVCLFVFLQSGLVVFGLVLVL